MATGGAPRRDGPVALSALFDDALRQLLAPAQPAGHGTARSGSVLTPPAAPAKPAAQTAARRGFFKSLLDKLF